MMKAGAAINRIRVPSRTFSKTSFQGPLRARLELKRQENAENWSKLEVLVHHLQKCAGVTGQVRLRPSPHADAARPSTFTTA